MLFFRSSMRFFIHIHLAVPAAAVIALVCGFVFFVFFVSLFFCVADSKAKCYVNPSAIVDVSVAFAIRSLHIDHLMCVLDDKFNGWNTSTAWSRRRWQWRQRQHWCGIIWHFKTIKTTRTQSYSHGTDSSNIFFFSLPSLSCSRLFDAIELLWLNLSKSSLSKPFSLSLSSVLLDCSYTILWHVRDILHKFYGS